MNYKRLQKTITKGVHFFSDGDGTFRMVRDQFGVEIVNGVEVTKEPQEFTLKGEIRAFSARDIDGETILAGDRRGIFTYEVEIKQGDTIFLDGQAYIVTDPRPVKPTGTVIAYRPILRRKTGGSY